MKVYSLIGFVDYEGSNLIGVFASFDDAMQVVRAGNGSWMFDDMGIVESNLGDRVDYVGYEDVVTVEFVRR